ncbi:2OG-Fe(II) oxygenase family protein [Streptomyces sp. NPDC048057]|uniref:2OG-Fe(II) oxygenase family protein n=1 Tax=Streptomyces sp. NPDC048057 TaxID=3155628 RepID=UPI0033F6E374
MSTVPLTLQRAVAAPDDLRFDRSDGLRRALHDGVFALAVPDDLDLRPGITLCREFHHPPQGDPVGDAYRGFRDRVDVYFDREDFQVEHVLTDAAARTRHFPAPLTAMVDRMTELALLVFRTALVELGIPGSMWRHVTGGAVDGLGTHWFVAHHYRGHRTQVGCAPHRDTGYVTVLHAQQPGLEVRSDGAWIPVDPVPGHFLVNFGQSFAILTERLPLRTTAALHRVREYRSGRPGADRISFAAFVDPPATGVLRRMHPDGSVTAAVDIEEFLRANNESTWSDHEGFGVSTSRQS